MEANTIKIIKTIAHEKRVKILGFIKENNNNACYSSLVNQSKIAPTTLNFHLKKLQDAKLVLTKQVGAKYLLSINEALLNKAKEDFLKL